MYTINFVASHLILFYFFQNYLIFQNRVLLIHNYRIHKAAFNIIAAMNKFIHETETRAKAQYTQSMQALGPMTAVAHHVTAYNLGESVANKLHRKKTKQWKQYQVATSGKYGKGLIASISALPTLYWRAETKSLVNGKTPAIQYVDRLCVICKNPQRLETHGQIIQFKCQHRFK